MSDKGVLQGIAEANQRLPQCYTRHAFYDGNIRYELNHDKTISRVDCLGKTTPELLIANIRKAFNLDQPGGEE